MSAASLGARPAEGHDMDTVHEPARDIPVADEVDICVIGGSCTGVFAAKLGARVAIVEEQGSAVI